MGKGNKKKRREVVSNTDLQTPKVGSKRRQEFSPTGLSPEEKLNKPGSTGPLSPGGLPPTSSLSAGGPEVPRGHGSAGGSPDSVSAAPSTDCRPRVNPGNPTVASGPGGLGDGHHDLFRGTSPQGPGASNEATSASSVAAGDGSIDPNSLGASSSPARNKADKIKLGHLAELLGIPEAEAALDPLCRAVASCPGLPTEEGSLNSGQTQKSSEVLAAAEDGLLHPDSEEASPSPSSPKEAMDVTDDSQSSFITSKTSQTPSASGSGSLSTSQSPEPAMVWGDNISLVLSKDKARKLRRKENIKRAKARKAEANLANEVAAFNISGSAGAPSSSGSDPKKDDGTGAKKSFKAAAKPKEFIRGHALLNISAIGTDKDGNPKQIVIPKSKWLSFIGEFQSNLTKGWEFDRSILLNAPKTHWIGWRSGRGQILTKDKDGTDRLVHELTDHPISVKGSKCKLAVNFRDRAQRPERKWCGVFLPAFHIVPDVEICKILAGSGFSGSVTSARVKSKVTDNGTWIKFQANPELVAELMAIQSSNLAPATWVGMDVKIRIFGKEEGSAPDDPPSSTENPTLMDQ